MMAAELEEKQHLLGDGGAPSGRTVGREDKRANLMACFEWTGSTSLGETILFLSESVTSEALGPQMMGRHLKHHFLIFRI